MEKIVSHQRRYYEWDIHEMANKINELVAWINAQEKAGGSSGRGEGDI